MDINDIGLIIWGCKGGYRVICHNGVVEPNRQDIGFTIKDLRSFVRFNRNRLTIYALEFAPEYKVFTVYRSCNDSGTGGYVAITLYVPHSLHVGNVRELLDTMIDQYFREFVHPLYGTFVPGKYDDIKPFRQMLGASAIVTKERQHTRRTASIQDDRPQLRLYKDVSEVDEFFASPYRNEFFRCQEVVFMSEDIYGDIPASLTFNISEPQIIEHVSDPEPLPKLFIESKPDSCIRYFKLNGEAVDFRSPVSVNDDDYAEIVFSAERYRDKVVKGRIEDLKYLQDDDCRFLIARDGNYRLDVVLQYKDYRVSVTVNGEKCRDGLMQVLTASGRCLNVVGSVLHLSGRDIDCPLEWKILPFDTGKEYVSFGKTFGVNDGSMTVDDTACTGAVNVDVGEHDYMLDVDEGVGATSLHVDMGGHIVDIPVKGGEAKSIKLYFPRDMFRADEFAFAADGANVTLHGDSLTVSAATADYVLDIPEEAMKHVESWDFVADGVSRRDGDKIRAGIEQITSGKLLINGRECLFQRGEGKISPYLCLVNLAGERPVWLQAKSGDGIELKPGFTLLPRNPDKEINCHGLKERGRRVIGNVVEVDYASEQATGQHLGSLNLKLTGCKGFEAKSDSKMLTIDDDKMSIELADASRAVISNGENECIIYRDKSKYDESVDGERNRQNGFDVTYSADGKSCEVAYTGIRKDDGGSGRKPLVKRILIAVASVLAVAIAAIVVYNLLSQGKEVYATMDIVAEDNPYFEEHITGMIADENPYFGLVERGEKDGIWSVNVYYPEEREYKEQMNLYIDKFKSQKINVALSTGDTCSVTLEDRYKELVDAASAFTPGGKPVVIPPYIIASPAKAVIDSLVDAEYGDALDVMFVAYSNVMGQYGQAEAFLLGRCWNAIDKQDSVQIAKFEEYFGSREAFKHYADSIAIVRDNMNREAQQHAQQAQRMSQLSRELKGKKDLLQSRECSAATVNSVKLWWNGLSGGERDALKASYDIGIAIASYEKFFNASGVQDMNYLRMNRRWVFSPYQYNIIYLGYGKDSATFNDWKKAMGMSFSEPEERGFVDESGKPVTSN